MTLKTYELPYGDTVKTVALPEDEVIAEVRTKSFTPIPKEAVKSKILEAIRNPIGIGPLDERVKPGDTVCFICNDLTRVANSFDFMPVFLDELNRLGVPDDHMKIVFSLGAHRKMTRDEMAEAVGEEVAARVPMFNSDCYADQDFYWTKPNLSAWKAVLQKHAFLPIPTGCGNGIGDTGYRFGAAHGSTKPV